jgi:hypothetical protein
MELAIAFPLGFKEATQHKVVFQQFVPTQERALHLFDTYYEYTSWM